MKIRIGNKKDLALAKEKHFEACFWNSNIQHPDYNEFFQNPEINKLLSGRG
jgi:hypothetical protein